MPRSLQPTREPIRRPLGPALRGLHRWLLASCAAAWVAAALAQPVREAPPVAADPALERRVMQLAAELRCLVCQNQTIADSHADLAVDLRSQIREQLTQGRSEDQIRTYMTDRYGDFVLYKPPFKATTALLWVGPPLLMAGALAGLFVLLRQRQRAAPEAFDPDTPEEDVSADDEQEAPAPTVRR